MMAYKVLKPDKILLYLNKQTMVTSLMARFIRITSMSVIISSLNILSSRKSIYYKWSYKCILRQSENAFFIYKDDYDMINKYKLGCKEQSVLLRSWGVDMNYFTKIPLPKTDLVYMSMPVLCCYGLKCYIETAKLVREKYPKVRFLLSGKFVEDPSVLSERELDEACESNYIYYIEDVKDIRPYLEVCSIFVQPNVSVKEGHIIEAEAAGRPILASDHPVNRSLVIEGYNGFILPVAESGKWADKIILLLEKQKLKTNMGDYSFELCSRRHDRKKINKFILEKLESQIFNQYLLKYFF